MPDATFLYVTAPDAAVAERIAETLVDERLAACVNLLPDMRSIYRWEGKVERAEEIVMVVKTATDRVAAASLRIRELHPYTTPCIVALPIATGNADYLAWITAETRLS